MFSDLKKLALLGALFVSAQGYAYTEDQSDFGFGVEAIMGINGGVNCNYDGAAKIKNPVGGPEVGLALYFRAFKFYIGADGRFEYDAFRSLHKVYSQSILLNNNVKTDDKDYSEGFSFAYTAAPVIGFDIAKNKSIWFSWNAMDQCHTSAKLPGSKSSKSVFNMNSVKVAYKWTIAPYFRLHLEYTLRAIDSFEVKSEDPKLSGKIKPESNYSNVFGFKLSIPVEIDL